MYTCFTLTKRRNTGLLLSWSQTRQLRNAPWFFQRFLCSRFFWFHWPFVINGFPLRHHERPGDRAPTFLPQHHAAHLLNFRNISSHHATGPETSSSPDLRNFIERRRRRRTRISSPGRCHASSRRPRPCSSGDDGFRRPHNQARQPCSQPRRETGHLHPQVGQRKRSRNRSLQRWRRQGWNMHQGGYGHHLHWVGWNV